jgi:hypothetical protein
MSGKLQTVKLSTSKCKLGHVNNTKANNRVEKWLHSALTLAIGGCDLQCNNLRYPQIRRLGDPEIKDEINLLYLWESNRYFSVIQSCD